MASQKSNSLSVTLGNNVAVILKYGAYIATACQFVKLSHIHFQNSKPYVGSNNAAIFCLLRLSKLISVGEGNLARASSTPYMHACAYTYVHTNTHTCTCAKI